MLSATGWIALALMPLNALVGIVLRRFVPGRFAVRMRTHYLVGYATLAFAVVHLWLSMVGMQGADATGISFATLALGALGLQTFIGASLQAPGSYRVPLRRSHIAALFLVLTLSFIHIAINGPFSSGMFTSSAPDR